MIVSNERMEKALKYLATTDEECARAKAHMESLAEARRIVRARLFLESNGKSAAEKENSATAHPAYESAVEAYANAVADYELYRNKRETEMTIVRAWQTENANRRQGNI